MSQKLNTAIAVIGIDIGKAVPPAVPGEARRRTCGRRSEVLRRSRPARRGQSIRGVSGAVTQKRLGRLQQAPIRMLSAAITLVIAFTLCGDLELPATATGWLGFSGVALGSTVGTLAFFCAIPMIGAVRATMISNVEPLLGIVFAVVLLGEKLSGLPDGRHCHGSCIDRCNGTEKVNRPADANLMKCQVVSQVRDRSAEFGGRDRCTPSGGYPGAVCWRLSYRSCAHGPCGTRPRQCRRIATRYDKLAVNYLALVKLASIRIWLRAYVLGFQDRATSHSRPEKRRGAKPSGFRARSLRYFQSPGPRNRSQESGCAPRVRVAASGLPGLTECLNSMTIGASRFR